MFEPEEISFRHLGVGYVLVKRGRQPRWKFWDYELVRIFPHMVVVSAIRMRDASGRELFDFFRFGRRFDELNWFQLDDRVKDKVYGFFGHDLYRKVDKPLVIERKALLHPPASVVAKQKPDSYVIIEVVFEGGGPARGVQLELTVPGGSVRTLVTDHRGQARADGIDSGSCTITLPSIDQSRWSADGSAGTHARSKPGPTHIVRQGESLLRIAYDHGQRDWQKVWDDPRNAALKSKRKSPNILLPGDRVVLPDVRVGEIERATDATHRIVLVDDDSLVTVELQLQARFKKALEGLAYTISFMHQDALVTRPGAGPSNETGVIKEQVPVDVESILIAFERPKVTFTLRTSVLDPMQDVAGGGVIASGVNARLRALGYAPAGGGDLVEAVARFQQAELSRADPTGEVDSETLNKLEELYGA